MIKAGSKRSDKEPRKRVLIEGTSSPSKNHIFNRNDCEHYAAHQQWTVEGLIAASALDPIGLCCASLVGWWRGRGTCCFV